MAKLFVYADSKALRLAALAYGHAAEADVRSAAEVALMFAALTYARETLALTPSDLNNGDALARLIGAE